MLFHSPTIPKGVAELFIFVFISFIELWFIEKKLGIVLVRGKYNGTEHIL